MRGRRVRLKGVDIRPGAVRQARLEAGLSLAQVAGNDITRAAIHLIENGRSRPSMPTLELISRRTGKPVSYFLAEPSPVPGSPVANLPRLDEIESLAAHQDFTAVARLAESMLGELQDGWTEARLRFHLGHARIRLLDTQGALQELGRAREMFAGLGDRWMVVECMDWQAAAMIVEQNPAAIRLAEEALQECRGLDPVPVLTEARILTHLAGMHVVMHDWPRAIATYQEVLGGVGGLRDLNRLAPMYEGLSVAYRELGSAARAAEYSHRAIAIHSLMHDQAALCRAQSNLGLVLLRQGELANAEQQLRESIATQDAIGLERGKSQALISLGEVRLRHGDLPAAEALIGEGLELAERLGERLSIARAHEALGRLGAESGEAARSDREFGIAIALFRELGVEERLVETLSAHAEALERRGETEQALWRWKEALSISRPQLVRSARSHAAMEELIG